LHALRRPWRKLNQPDSIPAVDRQVLDGLGCHQGADGGPIRLQGSRLSLNFQGLRHISQLHLGINAYPVAGCQSQVPVGEHFEAGGLNGHRVIPNRQKRKRVVTGGIGFPGAGESGIQIFGRDLSRGDHRSRVVRNRSHNVGCSLSEQQAGSGYRRHPKHHYPEAPAPA
jgi:hypothetical protein